MATQEYVLAQELTGDERWLILRSPGAAPVFRIAKDEAGFARDIFDNLVAGRAWEPPKTVELVTESLGDSDDDLASSA